MEGACTLCHCIETPLKYISLQKKVYSHIEYQNHVSSVQAPGTLTFYGTKLGALNGEVKNEVFRPKFVILFSLTNDPHVVNRFCPCTSILIQF